MIFGYFCFCFFSIPQFLIVNPYCMIFDVIFGWIF